MKRTTYGHLSGKFLGLSTAKLELFAAESGLLVVIAGYATPLATALAVFCFSIVKELT
ncbi:hypothetical protein QUA42_01025 [Microcoleus sp. Pol11C2]|uniref:hypothetical protein n=1 Tax=Microcoleus sp. Pol11C2 TaxID=3055389 RepID=UPI002FD05169